MKNALGDSVAIVSGYRPPRFDASNLSNMAASWSGRTVRMRPKLDTNTWMNPFAGDTGPGWVEPETLDVVEINPACTYTGGDLAVWDPKNPDGGLPAGSGTTAGCTTWVYELDYGAGAVGPDPGPPFEAFADWALRKPGPATGTWEDPGKVVWREGPSGLWKAADAANIIGGSTTKVNWGLLAYSSTELSKGVQCDYTVSPNNLLLSAIKPEGGSDGRQILDQMRLQRDGGLEVGGGTPTRTALDKAQQLIIDTFAVDEKYQCLRTYGVILVTDGESNLCNQGTPADGPWSGNDIPCPGAYTLFPASVSDDIWNLALKTPCVGKPPRAPEEGVINPRTWVIGFGGDVGKCELNFTAFMGRTDASSPNPDAGFAWTRDPRLCSTGIPATCAPNVATYIGNYQDSEDYAFFADETAGLVDAFDSIINATATGDYSTSAPIAGGAIGQGQTVLLASTEFPRWEGHLYKINTAEAPGSPGYREWDAADKLNERCEVAPCPKAGQVAKPRKIYTWDPRVATLDLVPVTADATTLTKLRAIETAVTGNAPTLTANIVDFIRGNDGTLGNKPREARLGPLVNTTPALVGGPAFYKQGTLVDHQGFETQYKDRRPMIWVGSSDGMLHAFDFFTGEEVVAILPPQLLASQTELYEGFTRILDGKLNPTSSTGQPKALNRHIYGVANSLRFGDIYFGTEYRTVAFLTLGPGGDVLTALDITHPYPGDPLAATPIPPDPKFGEFPGLPAGSPNDLPVQVIWSKTGAFSGGTLSTNYYASWSIPALGPFEADKAAIVFGNGHNPASRRGSPPGASQVVPHAFVLNPVDGTAKQTNPISDALGNGSNPWVGNQTFADAVVFRNDASEFRSDNLIQTGLQADLNGRVWYIPLEPTEMVTDNDILIDASSVAKQSQPLYYPPAAGGFGIPADTQCNVYALGSGSFYEKSPLVSGVNVGMTGNFIPSLFIASNDKSKSRQRVPDNRVLQIPINTIKTPDGSALLDPQSQLTAPPFMLIDPKGVAPTTAIFVVYDPTKGCNGNAYVVAVKFTVSGCVIASHAVTTYDAGAGASSGGTIAGGEYYVAKSGVGEGQQADLYKPPDIKSALGGGRIFRPVWWKELK
jgi:hypothetical protein